MIRIDINCDVGEGIGNEEQLMPLISSCNIACGGHAGNQEIMEMVTQLAISNSVKIGAHPGYEDRANFGRVPLPLSRKQLHKSITSQIQKLNDIVVSQGANLHHVKPHGALYNKAAVDRETAKIIVEAVATMDAGLFLYAPYDSVLVEEAKGIVPVKVEGFADRNYNNDYTLVSRSEDNALIENPEEVLKHIKSMICEHELVSIQGLKLPIALNTLCVHGDTSTALEILRYIHKHAASFQIQIT